jgi:hypothetical protein
VAPANPYDEGVSARPLAAAQAQLFTSTHRRILVDAQAALVRVIRTRATIESLEDCAEQYRQALRAMVALPRARMSLLLDVRQAPLRNDPALEATVAPHRASMCAGFRRVATLVGGSLQHLQFTRYGREDGSGMRLFESEMLALDYLCDAPNGPKR